MSLAADRRVRPVTRLAPDAPLLTTTLAAGLLVAASTHVTLAVEHGPSLFAVLSIGAGITQAALAADTLRRRARATVSAAMVLSLVLTQLFVLNVTTGLPPVIAHTHVPGTHLLLGVTLAWPNEIDAAGVVTQLAHAIAVTSGALLLRDRGRPRAP